MINPLHSRPADTPHKADAPAKDASGQPPALPGESFSSSNQVQDRKIEPQQIALAQGLNSPTADQQPTASGVPLGTTGKMVLGTNTSIYKMWEFETAGPINSTPAVLSGDVLVFAGTDGKVHAVKDGSKIWDFDAGGQALSSPQVTRDGLVLCSSSNGRIYALKDGRKVWDFDTETRHGGGVLGHPVEGPDGRVYAGAGNGNLYFLSEGRDEYGVHIGDWMLTPVIGKDGTIYVKEYLGKITAHKYSNGFFGKKVKLLWEASTGAPVQNSESSIALGADDTVYAGASDGKVVALKKGKSLWEFQTGGAVNSTPTIGPDGTVYVGSDDGKLYALKDGQKTWEFKTRGAVRSRPVIGKDGTVYVGSDDGKVYGIKDGAMVWHFETKGPIRSSPVVKDDGTIYVTSNDGKLYALSRSPLKERYKDIIKTSREEKPEIAQEDEWVIIDGTKLPKKK